MNITYVFIFFSIQFIRNTLKLYLTIVQIHSVL